MTSTVCDQESKDAELASNNYEIASSYILTAEEGKLVSGTLLSRDRTMCKANMHTMGLQGIVPCTGAAPLRTCVCTHVASHL